MRGLSLFTGIGGLDLAAQRAGVEVAAMCEIEPFCQEILRKRFPHARLYGDIRELDGKEYAGIDIVFGGFPCQDLSSLGRRQGLDGERSGLWFEMERIIREARPAWVLAENVFGAVSLALDTVRANLERECYEVRAVVLPAAALGAPYMRDRLFVVAARRDIAESLRLPDEGGAEEPPTEAPPTEAPPTEAPPTKEPDSDFRGKQLNADWLECFMGYPDGWTNPDVAEAAEWKGWPAPCSNGTWRTLLRSDFRTICKNKRRRGLASCFGWGEELGPQFGYEPPRFAKQSKLNTVRIMALGNSVVPQQAYPFFKAVSEARHG